MDVVLEALSRHYEVCLGTPTRRQQFGRHDASVGVWSWDPAATNEGVWLHTTLGASTLAGTVSPGQHSHEFFTGLLYEHDGVAGSLAALAGYEHDTGNALDHGHTVSSEGPLWVGAEMRTWLILRPKVAIIPPLPLDDSVHIVFEQALPLHSIEREYKVRTSAEALMSQFQAQRVPFWDGDRPPFDPTLHGAD